MAKAQIVIGANGGGGISSADKASVAQYTWVVNKPLSLSTPSKAKAICGRIDNGSGTIYEIVAIDGVNNNQFYRLQSNGTFGTIGQVVISFNNDSITSNMRFSQSTNWTFYPIVLY